MLLLCYLAILSLKLPFVPHLVLLETSLSKPTLPCFPSNQHCPNSLNFLISKITMKCIAQINNYNNSFNNTKMNPQVVQMFSLNKSSHHHFNLLQFFTIPLNKSWSLQNVCKGHNPISNWTFQVFLFSLSK